MTRSKSNLETRSPEGRTRKKHVKQAVIIPDPEPEESSSEEEDIDTKDMTPMGIQIMKDIQFFEKNVRDKGYDKSGIDLKSFSENQENYVKKIRVNHNNFLISNEFAGSKIFRFN